MYKRQSCTRSSTLELQTSVCQKSDIVCSYCQHLLWRFGWAVAGAIRPDAATHHYGRLAYRQSSLSTTSSLGWCLRDPRSRVSGVGISRSKITNPPHILVYASWVYVTRQHSKSLCWANDRAAPFIGLRGRKTLCAPSVSLSGGRFCCFCKTKTNCSLKKITVSKNSWKNRLN